MCFSDVEEMPTSCLVPGDVIIIPSKGCTMSCDAVLLSGNAIVNESMLTGISLNLKSVLLCEYRKLSSCPCWAVSILLWM